MAAPKKSIPELKQVSAFRLKATLKPALKRAADADSRTVNGLVEKILSDWLKENGFLK